jgi:hypothetical protein
LFAVGARRDDDTGQKSGSAYVFERTFPGLDAWALVEKFVPPAADRYDQFGLAVALGQYSLGVGSRLEEVTGRRSASTHIYRLKFNNAPALTAPIPDAMAVVGVPFQFVLPAGAFADADADDVLTLSSAYVGPGAPPAWLTFNPATGTYGGTPDAAATLPIEVTATDTDGAIAAATFRIYVTGAAPGPLSPLEAWRLEQFGPEARAEAALESLLWGHAADPDADGLTNLEEYLCGTNPLTPTSPEDRLALRVEREGDGAAVAVTFRRRKDDPRCTYGLQTSADLSTWETPAAILAIETALPINEHLEWVTLHLPVGQEGGGRQFFRLQVRY